jgi:hypothetical protein
MTAKTTKLIGLGRSTAAKTFTRNNNRGSRHVTAGKQERVGNHPALLHSLILPCLVSLVSLVSLGVAATPAMAAFGLERFALGAQNQDGAPDIQAGSHPYAFTTTFLLNKEERNAATNSNRYFAQGNVKNATVELPPGFVGDPNATPKCNQQTLLKSLNGGDGTCPTDTAVGLATPYIQGVKREEYYARETVPVYNMEPPAGVAAEFAFVVKGTEPVYLYVSVRAGGDYGLTASSLDISQSVAVVGSKVTIWGVPAAPSHNKWRGGCLGFTEEVYEGVELTATPGSGVFGEEAEQEGSYFYSTGECPVDIPQLPLLTNPTSCGTPRTATARVESWEEPGVVDKRTASLPELVGCEKLDFSPTIGVKPDSEAGSTPAGLNVNLDVPQEATENPAGLAEADVKDTTVTLPAGMQLSPSAADGLQACSNAQIGYTGLNKELNPTTESGVQTPQFKEKVYNPATGLEEATLCPDASKIANVKIKTPLLEGELEGSVYLAAPQDFAGLPENPFGSLVAMYLVAEEPKAGVIVKLPGKVSPNPVTGQITTTFENTPQLPFSELKLEFYGTERAPLATPAFCGTYKTEASLQPWSGTPAVSPLADFAITSGPNGSSCTYPGQALPFSPTLETGVPNVNAGAFSNLTTTFSREDGQQNLSGITLHYPPGLSGILTGIPLCGEAEANAGTCSAASEIGETIVSVGLGGDPFSVTGGKVYLTGPYDGAPFGLSIVNPAKAGPFDLQEGRPVIVRAKIEVNPLTAALTVSTTNEIPHIIDGIPLQIKHVNVNITRQGFTFNPTSCNPMKVEGTITSAEGGSSTVSDPFQVTNCQALKFAPDVSFSTSGKTSKADGADLITKITYPSAPQGTYANVGYVKVELPKQLPSRLTTLQKACTNAQFEANPAGCPSESKIGYAVVHTPLVPVPLEGPAIFVSHGGEAFPSLTMVLQGYGVKVDLVGTTFISKSGITSTTFKQVPDAPFTSFELVLPQGKYSALAANGNLCTSKLVMPNEFVSQAGGAPLKQSSTISVTGCKPAIAVKNHKVKGNTATLQVSVPAAGKLVASGKGLSRASKTAGGASTVTVKLHPTNAETTRLSKHRGRKLRAKIKLQFTPTKGAKLTTSVTVLIG